MGKDFKEFLDSFDWEADKDRYADEVRNVFHDISPKSEHITAMEAAAAAMVLARRETLYMIEKYHEWLSAE